MRRRNPRASTLTFDFIKMKKLIQTVAAVAIITSMTGCASTKCYFIDRGRDAADIVTLAAGVGLGAKVRLGPLDAGLLINHDTIGLRGGEAVVNHGGHGGDELRTLEFDTPLKSIDGFDYGYDRHKNYMAKGKYGFSQLEEQYKQNRAYYSQIEIVCAMLGSIRLGVNLGELADFILGWTTIDIFNDDLEAKKREEKSNKVQQDTR